MRELAPKGVMPSSIVLEEPRFVPRLVMTTELNAVMRMVVEHWKVRERFEKLRKFDIRPLDRLLFYGPPGNGKTMACGWIARELKIPMYRVLCNNLHGSCLGDTTRNVNDVMRFLNSLTEPALCLWDEAEAIFIDRKRSSGQCDREIQAALTVFMQCLDRWTAPTLLVLATNLPEQMDAALLSRFEAQIEFAGPDEGQCLELLSYWREMLHECGAEAWGPGMEGRIRAKRPESFRALQQGIAGAARDWVAK